jgi:hypothetical protein
MCTNFAQQYGTEEGLPFSILLSISGIYIRFNSGEKYGVQTYGANNCCAVNKKNPSILRIVWLIGTLFSLTVSRPVC